MLYLLFILLVLSPFVSCSFGANKKDKHRGFIEHKDEVIGFVGGRLTMIDKVEK